MPTRRRSCARWSIRPSARRRPAEHQTGRPRVAGRRSAGHRAADQPGPAVPPVDDGQRDTVLAALRDTGFIGYGDQHIGASNAAAVITGGSLNNDAGNQGVSVARFAAALAPHGSGVMLAGRDGSSGRARRSGRGPRRRLGDPGDQHRRQPRRRVRPRDSGPGRGRSDQRRSAPVNTAPVTATPASPSRLIAQSRDSRCTGRVSDGAAECLLGWVSVGRQAQSWKTALTRG